MASTSRPIRVSVLGEACEYFHLAVKSFVRGQLVPVLDRWLLCKLVRRHHAQLDLAGKRLLRSLSTPGRTCSLAIHFWVRGVARVAPGEVDTGFVRRQRFHRLIH
jgi:hypothetical protein